MTQDLRRPNSPSVTLISSLRKKREARIVLLVTSDLIFSGLPMKVEGGDPPLMPRFKMVPVNVLNVLTNRKRSKILIKSQHKIKS